MSTRDDRPHVLVLGTGGTIAGSTRASTGTAYTSAVLGIADLVHTLPGLESVARLSTEQLWQLDSVEMGLSRMLELARRVQDHLDNPDVDAVVVAHGTDTMEESAYLLNLVLTTDKPVVFLGSMRPADALSPDGPDNLHDAICVAASRHAAGQGVLVILDDRIHAARDVAKANTTRTDAFRSPWGPLGEVIGGQPHFVRAPIRAHTMSSAFDIRRLTTLPPTESLATHPEMPMSLLDAVTAAGIKGLVHVGPGNGNISAPVLTKLSALAADGLVVVRASRVGAGVVTRNGAIDDDRHRFVAGQDHQPAHARLLLALALTVTDDPTRVQRLFDAH